MKRVPIILLAIAVVAVAVLMGSLTPARAVDPACGPGSHWIHSPPCLGPAVPPAADDHYDSTTAIVGIDVDQDCLQDLTLTLTGPVDIDRAAAPSDDSANFPGTRPVDGHLDVIDTEIVSMELTGGGVTLRAGFYNPNYTGGQHTRGAVAEQYGDPALADSFFDVYFEIDPGPLGGPLLYNHTPHRVEAVIDRAPPEAVYQNPGPFCLPLYDHLGMQWPANLVFAQHDTRLPPTGGIVELSVDSSDSPARVSERGGASPPYAAIAGAAAAAALAITVGVWYARRRWLR